VALRLSHIHDWGGSAQVVYASVSVALTTTIATHVANMATTLPCLKQFLAIFESGMIRECGDTPLTTNNRGTEAERSMALTTLGGTGSQNEDRLDLAQGASETMAVVSADSRSIESGYSSALMIKRTQEWHIARSMS
jgi:hypothetical protein